MLGEHLSTLLDEVAIPSSPGAEGAFGHFVNLSWHSRVLNQEALDVAAAGQRFLINTSPEATTNPGSIRDGALVLSVISSAIAPRQNRKEMVNGRKQPPIGCVVNLQNLKELATTGKNR